MNDKKRKSSFFIKDKKDTELMIGTFVVIVLAILVLITLLVFWELQTGKFSEFINSLFVETNVDAVVASCNTLATQNAVYDYCCSEKKVRYKEDGKMMEQKLTCNELSEKPFGNRIDKLDCGNAGC